MHISAMPAARRMVRTRSQLTTSAPFFGSLALQHCALVERADIETAAVDGTSLFYSPAYVESLNEPELLGVWVHEVFHLAGLHHTRRGNREPGLWNESCDYAINPRVIAAGYTLPKGALLSPEFDGMAAEQIYAILYARRAKQRAEKNAAGGSQGGNDGSGAATGAGNPSAAAGGNPGAAGNGSAAPDPGRCGGVIDAAPTAAGNAAAAAAMESTVRQATAIAAAGAGHMPGEAAAILAELNRSRIDWRATVDRFIDDAATREVDWSRCSKRFLDADFFMPSSRADSVSCIGFAIDSSGSMDEAALSACRAELQAVLDSGRVERLHVVVCDTAVRQTFDYVPGDTVSCEVKGRGGTAFAPALAALEAVQPAAIIYLTDLDCRDFGPEPACPVLWAVTGAKRKAPFGEIMPLDPHS